MFCIFIFKKLLIILINTSNVFSVDHRSVQTPPNCYDWHNTLKHTETKTIRANKKTLCLHNIHKNGCLNIVNQVCVAEVILLLHCFIFFIYLIYFFVQPEKEKVVPSSIKFGRYSNVALCYFCSTPHIWSEGAIWKAGVWTYKNAYILKQFNFRTFRLSYFLALMKVYHFTSSSSSQKDQNTTENCYFKSVHPQTWPDLDTDVVWPESNSSKCMFGSSNQTASTPNCLWIIS